MNARVKVGQDIETRFTEEPENKIKYKRKLRLSSSR